MIRVLASFIAARKNELSESSDIEKGAKYESNELEGRYQFLKNRCYTVLL